MINKKLLFTAMLLASSQISAKFAGSVGIGGVARKTSVEFENVEFKNKSNAAYFAGRIVAKAGLVTSKNIFIGLRVAGDVGSDKKEVKENVAGKDVVTWASKSNFTVNAGPEIGYKINDKVCVHAALLATYQNIKISMTKDAIKEGAVEADKKHYYGFGGLVGLNYHFNKMISVFVEGGASYILKKDITFKTEGKTKLSDGTVFANNQKASKKSAIEFNGSVGLAVNFGS